MKPFVCSLSALALLTVQGLAQEFAIPSPRVDFLNPIRILLYVPGTDLLFDYPDVCRIHFATPTQIAFETRDQNVITHQGTYTIIQSRDSVAAAEPPRRRVSLRGPRFYDVK